MSDVDFDDLRDLVLVPSLLIGVVGGLEAGYGLLFGAMNALLALGGLGFNAWLAYDMGFDEATLAMLAFQSWTSLVTLVQAALQLALVIPGALGIRAALALQGFTSRQAVIQGSLAVAIGPFVLLLSNFLSICAANIAGLCCGFIFPLAFTFAGILAAVVAYNAASRPEILVAFEANQS